MNQYLTVYKGRAQRKRRPFSTDEERQITRLSFVAPGKLKNLLVENQDYPRYQRLVQEAIERKRREI